MKIYDLLDMDLLVEMIGQGYVRVQHHPVWPDLGILNYTETCQFAREWNLVTSTCRGLIYDQATGDVLARPFPKFFNHGEPGAPVIPLDAGVDVTDKLDGSLGILYPTPDGEWAVATRGSFDSEQARHATKVWRERYAHTCTPSRRLTLLMEIIYPANRIVCQYGDLDDLVLLGAVQISTGQSCGPQSTVLGGWPGPRTQTFHYRTLADALAAEPRPGAEGLVVRRLNTEDRIKIKQAEYVEMHKLVTGLNERVVWEYLGAGGTVEALCEPLPDEFHSWVGKVADRLTTARDATVSAAEAEHAALLADLPDGWTRKDYALKAINSPHRAILFQILDGRDPRPGVWRNLRPSGAVSMTGYCEDVA